MTGIKIQQSKFLLFPELSSGEAGEKNYINFNHALSGRNDHNGTLLTHDEKAGALEKAGRLETALRGLKTAIDDVDQSLNKRNNTND